MYASNYKRNGNNEFPHFEEEQIPLNPSSGRPADNSSSTLNKRHADEHHTHNPRREQWVGWIAIGASLLSVILCAAALLSFGLGLWNGSAEAGNRFAGSEDQRSGPTTESGANRQKEYAERYYDEFGRYVLEDYDVQPPFSDFLPGLAGYYGIPLYAFYVNRGQGIASFGFKSKEYPIQEFHSANLAYQSTAFTGFRTFLQIKRPIARQRESKMGVSKLIEPFGALQSRFPTPQGESPVLPKRYMYVGENEMQLQEIDYVNGIETNVTFFILPEEDFGAFAKRTTITNLQPGSRGDERSRRPMLGKSDIAGTPVTLSMLDGLAKVVPAGGKMNDLLKSMGRTLEGWMGVYSPYNDTIQMPFYRLSMKPGDSAAVTLQEAGHWCLSLLEESSGDSNVTPQQPTLLPIIHDPSTVFGDDTSLLRPVRLYSHAIPDIIHNEQQYGFAKTASAFAAVEDVTLNPGESLTITTFFGKADHVLDVPIIARRLLQPGFALFKMTRARELVKQITSGVETKTSNPLFDGHVQQMFLDNSLRGGIPQILGEDDDSKIRCADEDERLKVIHLFSRIHGDLERDYNDFEIDPTFFSSGPGNFRDVAQNRRNDVFFNPRIGAFNVKMFLSFIQADGYNPLKVEAVMLAIDDIDVCTQISAQAVGEADGHRAQREALSSILNAGLFRPGQLFRIMEQQNIMLIVSRQEFIDMVASAAKTFPLASYSSGFWADHWTYYIDLVDSFLSIYPDWEKRIFFDEQLPYFSSPANVNPRSRKYVLSFDGKGHHIRQLNATTDDEDEEGVKLLRSSFDKGTTGWDEYEANWKHDAGGHVFTSSPMEKLFLLATLKFATRDPYGVGLLYEGGKPGWNDANNGLVGMIGSGVPELCELAVLLRFIKSSVNKYKQDIVIPVELHQLVVSINDALETLTREYVDSNTLYPKVPKPLFNYWDAVATAQEDYRAQTKVTFSGSTRIVPYKLLDATLDRWLEEVALGMERGHKLGTNGYGDDGSSGVTPTYFSYHVSKWKKTGEVNMEGHPFVRALEMEVRLMPMFLEGPTRMMKTVFSEDEAKAIYEKVRASALRDDALQMYTVSASLKGQSMDMGREMAFTPGWLENQSVWLHMSYKFYLELLRHELYDEFFDEMSSGGMLPFMNPLTYGRSFMECSSFIASSAFEDPSVRGRGFLPRLSGTTSEFLSMWVLMMIGPRPFYMDDESGQLRLQFIPALPRSFFFVSDEGTLTISFTLFGAIDVTYYNLLDKNLFNISPSRYVVVLRDGTVSKVDGASIGTDLADKIRRVSFVASMQVYF